MADDLKTCLLKCHANMSRQIEDGDAKGWILGAVGEDMFDLVYSRAVMQLNVWHPDNIIHESEGSLESLQSEWQNGFASALYDWISSRDEWETLVFQSKPKVHSLIYHMGEMYLRLISAIEALTAEKVRPLI